MKSLIQKLTQTFGPSGYESAVRDVIRAEVEKYADEISVDALGSLIVRKGTKGGKRIMVAAHMDEIGIMASHIDDNGFIRFAPMGGVFLRHLVGGRVRFLDGTPGVIGVDDFKKFDEIPPMDKMYIDVGAPSKKDCPIKVGDVAGFDREFTDMGKRLVSKAMDDRIGCAVAIETLKALKSTPHDVYFVFTTQEEVGTRGAGTAAYSIDPEIGIALDVTVTGDTPNGVKMDVAIGKGPAVKIRDTGMIADPRIVTWMVQTAEKNRIPYQREVLTLGSTDARAIQLTRAGVPAGCISVGCRYVHSPSEMVELSDVENSVTLLTKMLEGKVPF